MNTNTNNRATLDISPRKGSGVWLRSLLLATFAGLLCLIGAPNAHAQRGVEMEAVVITAEAPQESERIDLNTATEAELVTLSGIGPSKAQAIIAYRERHPFRRVAEIMRVRGIGRATFRRLRDRLRVGT